MDFDFNIDLGFDEETQQKEPEPETEERHISVSHRLGSRHITRKVASEKALEEQLPWHFNEGDCFHCFSFGDVDSFTFLRMVMRQQPLKYVAISTWCMAGEDIKELRSWYFRGMVERVDFSSVRFSVDHTRRFTRKQKNLLTNAAAGFVYLKTTARLWS